MLPPELRNTEPSTQMAKELIRCQSHLQRIKELAILPKNNRVSFVIRLKQIRIEIDKLMEEMQ